MERIEKLKLYELYYMVNVYAFNDEDILPYDIYDIWRQINKLYNHEMKHSLDITKDANRGILYEWIRNKTRYELLDELLVHVYYRLTNKEQETEIDNTDWFFASNLNAMKNIMNEYYNKITPSLHKMSIQKVSSINKKQTIMIVKDILNEIDPNNEWTSIYEEAIKNNKIIYLNELTESQKEDTKNKLGLKSLKDINNSCMFLPNGESYIFLNYTNTLYDVPTTIHEIVHYISKLANGDNKELPVLREFPSIFFELYSLDYLKRIGYPESEITKINQSRLMDTFRAYDEIEDLMYYLIMLVSKGHINEKQDYTNTLKDINKMKKRLSKEDIHALVQEDNNFFDAGTRCHHRCDKVTEDLTINPYILFHNYPYIIGAYLGDIGIQRLKSSNTILPMIKYITEKISKMDAFDIFSILECDTRNLVQTNYTCERDIKKRSKLKKQNR